MDEAISNFLQYGTLILACAVYIITFLIRRITETAIPSIKKQADANDPKLSYKTAFSRWWNEVILYVLPIIVGCLFGLVKAPFMFGDDVKTVSGRIIVGGVIGWLSSFLYKVVKKLLVSKTGIDASSLPE